MSAMRSLKVNHESGRIHYCEGVEELFGCSIEQVGLSSSDSLEDFVIEAGGIKQAVLRMQFLLNN